MICIGKSLFVCVYEMCQVLCSCKHGISSTIFAYFDEDVPILRFHHTTEDCSIMGAQSCALMCSGESAVYTVEIYEAREHDDQLQILSALGVAVWLITGVEVSGDCLAADHVKQVALRYVLRAGRAFVWSQPPFTDQTVSELCCRKTQKHVLGQHGLSSWASH